MATEQTPIDLKHAPSLPELVDEVRKTRKSRIIRADGEDVAELRPLPKKTPMRGQRSKGFSREDPLFSVIGIGTSKTPADIAKHKDDYLADALLSEFHPTKP